MITRIVSCVAFLGWLLGSLGSTHAQKIDPTGFNKDEVHDWTKQSKRARRFVRKKEAAKLQIELNKVGCFSFANTTDNPDGDWGRGSVRNFNRFLDNSKPKARAEYKPDGTVGNLVALIQSYSKEGSSCAPVRQKVCKFNEQVASWWTHHNDTLEKLLTSGKSDDEIKKIKKDMVSFVRIKKLLLGMQNGLEDTDSDYMKALFPAAGHWLFNDDVTDEQFNKIDDLFTTSTSMSQYGTLFWSKSCGQCVLLSEYLRLEAQARLSGNEFVEAAIPGQDPVTFLLSKITISMLEEMHSQLVVWARHFRKREFSSARKALVAVITGFNNHTAPSGRKVEFAAELASAFGRMCPKQSWPNKTVGLPDW